MKIAILGANGFLGSYLSTYFSFKNYDVIKVTRQTLNLEKFHEVDKWLKYNKPDVIVNCTTSNNGKGFNDINYTNVQRDLSIFLNFYNSTDVKKYINIGSGAEFDRRYDINKVVEESILNFLPIESYGFIKNTISRLCLNRSNFYTLRLFGCFDKSEENYRLFKLFLSGKLTSLQDRYFDYISASDFAKIVEYYVVSENLLYKDINCVYSGKLKLSEILAKFNTNFPITVDSLKHYSYTGENKKLNSLNINLDGLDQGIKEYV